MFSPSSFENTTLCLQPENKIFIQISCTPHNPIQEIGSQDSFPNTFTALKTGPLTFSLTPFSLLNFINFLFEYHICGKTSSQLRYKDLSLGCTLCLRLYMLGHTGSAASYREGGCEDETQAALNVDFHPRLQIIAVSWLL